LPNITKVTYVKIFILLDPYQQKANVNNTHPHNQAALNVMLLSIIEQDHNPHD